MTIREHVTEVGRKLYNGLERALTTPITYEHFKKAVLACAVPVYILSGCAAQIHEVRQVDTLPESAQSSKEVIPSSSQTASPKPQEDKKDDKDSILNLDEFIETYDGPIIKINRAVDVLCSDFGKRSTTITVTEEDYASEKAEGTTDKSLVKIYNNDKDRLDYLKRKDMLSWPCSIKRVTGVKTETMGIGAKDKRVTRDEFKEKMYEIGSSRFGEDMTTDMVSDYLAEDMFKKFDINGDGVIDAKDDVNKDNKITPEDRKLYQQNTGR